MANLPERRIVQRGEVLDSVEDSSVSLDHMTERRRAIISRHETIAAQATWSLCQIYVTDQRGYTAAAERAYDVLADTDAPILQEVNRRFYKSRTDDLAVSIMENSRLAEAGIRRVTAASLPIDEPDLPRTKRHVLEERRLSFRERVRGTTWDIREE